MTDSTDKRLPTKLIHAGRSASSFGGTVNPPIQRASTVLTENVSGLYGGAKSLYGRMGMTVHDALSEGMNALEGATHTQLAANGLNACALAMASNLNAGDHLIASDSVYGPTRRFCEKYLAKMGVETTFVHPRIGTRISEYVRPNTKAIFLEMPGSLTFELHDIDPIVEIARKLQITTILDNTWSAGVFFKPLDHGIDVSVQALTKYVIGHSDAFGGAVMTVSPEHAAKASATAQDWGISMSPDDAYLAQRGLRTLPIRIASQGEKSVRIAEFLEAQDYVEGVFHPALRSHPDHDLWKRYFTGSSGLFSFCLKPLSKESLDRFFKSLSLFGFGFSWGGFESLMIPCDPQLTRSQSPEWANDKHGPLIRVSIGLEDENDLITDLAYALATIS